eukprot:TRINITY_DN36493_c0_g1_i2.p1 TRINITY_DN36493_c0_g1~~TRINITY_DN36493_c0_g1_i2.p1  ORF type:complete len:150 (+),score=37.16 TRINITY_DN36493_c0_g1_i2:148-597(+)
MAELAPAQWRAPFMAGLHVFWQIGVFAIVLLHNSLSWRALVLATALPALVVIPMAVVFLPESPRWLSLQKGRYQHMVDSLTTLEHGPRFLHSVPSTSANSYGHRVVVDLDANTGCGSFMEQALSLIHISEPTRLLSISYAVFCLKKKKS